MNISGTPTNSSEYYRKKGKKKCLKKKRKEKKPGPPNTYLHKVKEPASQKQTAGSQQERGNSLHGESQGTFISHPLHVIQRLLIVLLPKPPSTGGLTHQVSMLEDDDLQVIMEPRVEIHQLNNLIGLSTVPSISP